MKKINYMSKEVKKHPTLLVTLSGSVPTKSELEQNYIYVTLAVARYVVLYN